MLAALRRIVRMLESRLPPGLSPDALIGEMADEALGLGEGQRLQGHRVEGGEQRGGGPDAKGEGARSDGGEAGGPPHLAQRVADVVAELAQRVPESHVPLPRFPQAPARLAHRLFVSINAAI